MLNKSSKNSSNSILFAPHPPIGFVNWRIVLRSAATFLVVLCFDAAAIAAPLAQHVLANGMTVLVKEDHRSPVAVSMVWYRAGAMDEVSTSTGVAHMLEH